MEKDKIVLFVDLIDGTNKVDGVGTSPLSPSSIETIVDDSHSIFADNPRLYVYEGGSLYKSDELIVSKAKEKKGAELNDACRNAILEGFPHPVNDIIYWFSYDMEAQGNFRDIKEAFKDGIISEIGWTVREGGKGGSYTRITMTPELLDELSLVILKHKDDNISKYRDTLMPMVEGATTAEEVYSIIW